MVATKLKKLETGQLVWVNAGGRIGSLGGSKDSGASRFTLQNARKQNNQKYQLF